MSEQYPLVGQIVKKEYYYTDVQLYLVLGYTDLNIVLYPLCVRYDNTRPAYMEKFVENCVKVTISNTIDPYLVYIKELAKLGTTFEYKFYSFYLLNDKFYASKEILVNWYLKNKVVFPQLPDISFDFNAILESRLNQIRCIKLSDYMLDQLGVYKLSEKKCFVYLGYHKGLNTYFYLHLKTSSLESKYFYTNAKIKNISRLTNQFLACEKIGTVKKTRHFLQYLSERGLIL